MQNAGTSGLQSTSAVQPRDEQAKRLAEHDERREVQALAHLEDLGRCAKSSSSTSLQKLSTFDGTDGSDGTTYLATFSKQPSILEN